MIQYNHTLTDKEKVLVAEYFANGMHKKKAALKAGYNNISNLFDRPHIRAAIKAELLNQHITPQYVLSSLKEVADRSMELKPKMVYSKEEKDMVELFDKDGNQICVFDSNGAVRALELLGKYLKLFTDRTENINGNGSIEEYIKNIEEKDEY